MVAHPLIYAENRLAVAFWVSAGLWMVMECWVWLRERGVRGENRDRGSKA